jgi:predicted aconitase with swiveling domain
MGRRLVSILIMTMALSVVGAVMTATGAFADPKTATFTIHLSGAAEVCPTAPGPVAAQALAPPP